VSLTEIPTREELVRQVSGITPVIAANAAWAAEHRRLHEETFEALADAGVFRMRMPARFGGYECDARTMAEVADVLARADGSASWVAATSWIPTWVLGLFPDEVQDEVFATPDVRLSSTIGPGTATAVPAPGGIVVNGAWPFISGAAGSHWQQIMAILLDPAGEPYPVMGMVPTAELEIVDDWYAAGLRGTGSVTTLARDLFVPQERIVPVPALLGGQSASKKNAQAPMYRAPLIMVAAASTVGTCVGMARAVSDAFFDRLPGRRITYTEYTDQAQAPVTHLRVAEAALKIDEADFHARRLTELHDAKCATGQEWTLHERIRSRADEGAAARLALEAADLLAAAGGGSSAYAKVPLQGLLADLRTFALHGMMTPDVNTETYGRVLCGLPPNTMFF
jgi:alkylation response protein AidB-like acyl-CoA dehydrogenase